MLINPAELLGAGAGGFVLGGVVTLASVAMQLRAQQTELFIRTLAARTKSAVDLMKASDDSHDRAANRRIDGGKALRYLVAACLMFSLLSLFFVAVLDVNTVVRDEVKNPDLLWGFIEGGVQITYTELHGYYFVGAIIDFIAAVVGCLFGSASARGKL